MHCLTCPPERRAYCRGQGCQAPSAAPIAADPGAVGDLGLQVKRLDVENGDILVVRSKSRLAPVRAAEIHDQVAALASRHGIRDVTVMVLDDCSDLSVERPGPAQHFSASQSTPQK